MITSELLLRFFALPASSMQIVFGTTKSENSKYNFYL